jgi:predicted regulator of amino acid metabolism with ACT domain
MWDMLTEYFSRYPAQSEVARLMLDKGFSVADGKVRAGEIELADTAVARAADVDRRVVKATVETIEASDELYRVFNKLEPTCHIREAAPLLGWHVLEIVPDDASKPGILAGVANVIADKKISIRQAIVDDPQLAEEPRLFIVTEHEIPHSVLPEIQQVSGVREVVIRGTEE